MNIGLIPIDIVEGSLAPFTEPPSAVEPLPDAGTPTPADDALSVDAGTPTPAEDALTADAGTPTPEEGAQIADAGSPAPDAGNPQSVCSDGETLCAERCVIVASDDLNCGGCGIVCGVAETCKLGLCTAGCNQ